VFVVELAVDDDDDDVGDDGAVMWVLFTSMMMCYVNLMFDLFCLFLFLFLCLYCCCSSHMNHHELFFYTN
jgi:succinate-acetate transporter protein